MTKLFLNIGLAPSILFGGTPLTASNVYDALTIAGFTILGYDTRQSDSELTAVATVKLPDWCRDSQDIRTVVYSLAVVLRQEAIAFRPVNSPEGHLVGPHAAGWGEFNPDAFITPNPPGWESVQS